MTRSDATGEREAAIGLLEELVGFDTVSHRSNLALVGRVEAYIEGLGLEPVRIPNADGDKATLFVTVGPKGDGGLLLSGHTDVVPVKGQSWTTDPFKLREDGGKLFGRGACDMKGFDAVCLAMLPAFQRAELTRPIHLILSYDEEIGCLGSLDTIARFGKDLPKPAIAIIGEPTNMNVVGAHKSICTYQTTVHGHEAHSSNPEAGANAVEAACALVAELTRLQDTLIEEGDPTGLFSPGYSTVHVGTIEGGNARNILAKHCAFGWEFRGLPDVDANRAVDHLDAYAERVVLPKLQRYADDARIETHRDVAAPGLAAETGSKAEILVKRLAGRNGIETVSFATEAGQFQKAGISTVVCGPGSIKQAHQADEFIEIAQIDACIAFMRRLAEAASRD